MMITVVFGTILFGESKLIDYMAFFIGSPLIAFLVAISIVDRVQLKKRKDVQIIKVRSSLLKYGGFIFLIVIDVRYFYMAGFSYQGVMTVLVMLFLYLDHIYLRNEIIESDDTIYFSFCRLDKYNLSILPKWKSLSYYFRAGKGERVFWLGRKEYNVLNLMINKEELGEKYGF